MSREHPTEHEIKVADYEVRTRLAELQNNEHEHEYTIPVEWRHLDKWGDLPNVDYPPAKTLVTKLMCKCGAEKEREV